MDAPLSSDVYAAGVASACECCEQEPCPPSCDDGNACTRDYHNINCSGCFCVNEPRVCNDLDPCTNDSCNPSSGNCAYVPKNCNDGNDCTNDVCDPYTGACQHFDQCLPDRCCDEGPGFVCCADTPCGTGTCCGSGCCDTSLTCCNGTCCPTGAICCQGQCCGGPCQLCEERYMDPPTCLLLQCITEPACDDDNECTDDFCQTDCGDFECNYVPNTRSCQDDGDPCTRDVCDGFVGICTHPPGHDGAARASDGNLPAHRCPHPL